MIESQKIYNSLSPINHPLQVKFSFQQEKLTDHAIVQALPIMRNVRYTYGPILILFPWSANYGYLFSSDRNKQQTELPK